MDSADYMDAYQMMLADKSQIIERAYKKCVLSSYQEARGYPIITLDDKQMYIDNISVDTTNLPYDYDRMPYCFAYDPINDVVVYHHANYSVIIYKFDRINRTLIPSAVYKVSTMPPIPNMEFLESCIKENIILDVDDLEIKSAYFILSINLEPIGVTINDNNIDLCNMYTQESTTIDYVKLGLNLNSQNLQYIRYYEVIISSNTFSILRTANYHQYIIAANQQFHPNLHYNTYGYRLYCGLLIFYDIDNHNIKCINLTDGYTFVYGEKQENIHPYLTFDRLKMLNNWIVQLVDGRLSIIFAEKESNVDCINLTTMVKTQVNLLDTLSYREHLDKLMSMNEVASYHALKTFKFAD